MYLIIGAISGFVMGIAALLMDNFDGDVVWLGGWLHSKVVTVGVFLFAMVTLLWGFGVVPGAAVIGGLVSLLVQAITAYIFSFLLPFIPGV